MTASEAIAPPEARRLLRHVWAPILTALAAVTFAVGLWANNGPFEDNGPCDVYCGPANLIVASGIILLFPAAWILALVATIVAATASPRWVAIICGAVLLVPVVVLVVMFVSTH